MTPASLGFRPAPPRDVAGSIRMSVARHGHRTAPVTTESFGVLRLMQPLYLDDSGQVTYIILNNSSYRILKERMVSFRGTRSFKGMELRDPAIDFKALAEAMGVKASTVSDPREIDSALREAINSGAPRLLEFIVHRGVE